MIDKRDRERLLEQLDSPGWRAILELVIVRIHAWMGRLIEDPELSEAERKGYVHAIAALREGITGYYTQAERELPPWLEQELYFYRG